MIRSTCFRAVLTAVLAVGGVLVHYSPASAVPILQLYLEGATYDESTESWVLTPEGSSGGAPFRLWTIGNIDGPGGKGTIADVRLSIAFNQQFYPDLAVSLTPSQAGGLAVGVFQGISDPSVSPGASLNTTVKTSKGTVTTDSDGVVTNGSTPVLHDGDPLPEHGIFGDSTYWMEYALGDFDTPDSHIGDFIGSFPTELTSDAAQINVYDVSVTGGSGATVHFDLYNSIAAGNHSHSTFAPFSHDGDGEGNTGPGGADAEANIVPEPSAMAIWSLLAGVGLVGAWRRNRIRGS